MSWNRTLTTSTGRALAVVAVGAGAAILYGAGVDLPMGVKVVLAMMLVGVLPGYGFVAVAFRGGTLTSLERGAFVVASSFIVTVLTGLALNFTTGLTERAWGVTLGTLTVVGAGAALSSPSDDARPATHRIPVLSMRDAAVLALAVMLVGGGLVVSRYSARSQADREPPFTALGIRQRDTGSAAAVVTVDSHEYATRKFRLRVTRDGRQIASLGPLTLAAGSSRDLPLRLPATARGTGTVTVSLLTERGAVYRRVSFSPR